ncbi:deoxyribodipyrimidine photolyase-related protein [Microbacterium paludicola]|uniref:Deoxyribodipyrimidine photolyase-related protein n=1 Tax=Microbacterium paludicola TaxID=300019 RepID=A0ABU1I2C7_9MICO|nr:deoxyribodipyrimidine photolyase-related protein [Microbacterium paludicola]
MDPHGFGVASTHATSAAPAHAQAIGRTRGRSYADTVLRNLVIVLGDQLDPDASAFDEFDPAQDAVWMAEVAEESTHVWSSKPRTAVFLAAMRHFAADQRDAGHTLHYTELDARGNKGTLADQLAADLEKLKPEALAMTEPGEWRVREALQQTADAAGIPLDIRVDRHFFSTVAEFAEHAEGRASLRMEYFYREMRKRHSILMTTRGQPVGGQWNYDADNRKPFPKQGPGLVPPRATFPPDEITREVIELVEKEFGEHPGSLDSFAWPVTRAQALEALDLFIDERLPGFGDAQDAMWPGEPWLWHAHLSSSMNLKLLHPREVVAAAEEAYRSKRAPLSAVEGFIRQILGWREYVRGIYWTQMPGYVQRNAFEAFEPLPDWYWTGDTPMACLKDAVGTTLENGYAHHIQRLMVTGLYAMLLGVDPREVHAWYLAVYVDAVEWVELPNTLGMSQYADGGLMGSKPYAATGKYIDRMSPYCETCPFDPAKRIGDDACPFTTLYWDYLIRHEQPLAENHRMALQVKNLDRLDDDEIAAIRGRADAIRRGDVTAPEGAR